MSLQDDQPPRLQDTIQNAQQMKVSDKVEQKGLSSMVSSSLPNPFKRSSDQHLASQGAQEDGGLDGKQ